MEGQGGEEVQGVADPKKLYLGVGLVFNQLLRASVEEADVRIGAEDGLKEPINLIIPAGAIHKIR
jgi:hypothetical protein